MLFADMGQQHHVVTLTLADRAVPPSYVATRCDPQHAALAFDRNLLGMFFDKGKSHLLSPAKNTVAFFKSSLSSVSSRFSLRSRSFSFARLRGIKPWQVHLHFTEGLINQEGQISNAGTKQFLQASLIHLLHGLGNTAASE